MDDTKRRILMVSDVKGWGGWKRAEMIKKYLSNEFRFDIMDGNEFNDYERNSTPNMFNKNDLEKYTLNIKPPDKNFLNINHFRNWINNQNTRKEYDLIYLLFHLMLTKKSVNRLLNRGSKIVTIVTVFPTVRLGFINNGAAIGIGTYDGGRKLFLSKAKKCQAIFSNNIKSLKDLKSMYKGPTYYLPRGVSPEIFYPTSDEFVKKPKEKFTVAFCGKSNPEKGLKKYIIPACQEAGVKLITNERNFTNALPEKKMRNFYNRADAYIVASTMDGTPNTALEAAACGKPIVSNQIGNMPEFINKGKNGFLLPLEVEKYTNRLRWMANNQRKTWKMGLEARKTIMESWTWEKVLENERDAFRKILGG